MAYYKQRNTRVRRDDPGDTMHRITAHQQRLRADFVRRRFGQQRRRAATHVVSAISLHLLSSDAVRDESVGEMGNLNTYDFLGLPNRGGVMDPRSGAEDSVVCATCMNTSRSGNCHGHAGHIDLARPVYHPQMLAVAKNLLTVACFACGKCLVPAKYRAKTQGNILTVGLAFAQTKLGSKSSRARECPHCNLPCQPKFVKHTDMLTLRAVWELEAPESKMVRLAPPGMLAENRAALHDFNDDLEHTTTAQRALAHALSIPASDPDSVRAVFRVSEHLAADSIIIDALRVPEKAARPSRVQFNGRKSIHPLTRRLLYIATPNENLRKIHILRRQWKAGDISEAQVKEALKRPDDASTAEELLNQQEKFNLDDLGTQVINLFNSDKAMPMQRKKRHGAKANEAGIKQFLDGKYGLVRRRTPSGSVLFSGRAPLGPSPATWSLDDVGLPQYMAVRMTTNETVASFNLEAMRARVRRGYRVMNGANAVVSADGQEITLRDISQDSRDVIAKLLDVGWRVRRTLQDGDTVLVNRAPTLHAMNLLALKVRIIDGYRILLHHLLHKCFNFDYDGDEIMIHVPQDCEARADAMCLMNAQRYVISTTDGRPIICPALNDVLGFFILTAGDTRVRPQLAQAMVMAAAHHLPLETLTRRLPPPVDAATGCRTGKDMASILFPPDFHYGPVRMHTHGTRGNDGVVIIRGGRLVCGQWRKAVFSGSATITQAMERRYGGEATCAFLCAAVAMVAEFLYACGFSIGASDMLQRDEARGAAGVLHRRVCDAMARVDATDGTAEDKEVAKSEIASTYLQRASDLVMHFQHAYTEAHHRVSDPLLALSTSGTKGAPQHIAQMRIGLGQQMERGGRIFAPTTAQTAGSAGAAFSPGAHPPEAHGFIADAYGARRNGAFPDGRGGRMGIAPQSSITHAASGMSAMASTSCGVPTTGTFQRSLAKGGEFTVVRGNGLVFTGRSQGFEDQATGLRHEMPKPLQAMQHSVVQFVYGGNGFNPQHLAAVDTPWLGWEPMAAMERATAGAPEGTTNLPAVQAWLRDMMLLRAQLMSAQTPETLDDTHGRLRSRYPLVFDARLEVAALWSRCSNSSRSTGDTPPPFPDHVAALASCLREMLLQPMQRGTEGHMLPHVANVMWFLRPWQHEMRTVPVPALRQLCQHLTHKMVAARAVDGDNVGLIAMYAFGSSMTQAELDRGKHRVGEVDKSGISRMERAVELVACREADAKEPHTRLRLRPGITREAATAWVDQQTFLQLHMLLQPHCHGGSRVLVLPTDARTQLHACERAAWEMAWQLHGVEPPSADDEPRVVVALRLARTVCRRRRVSLEEVVAFVRKEVWRVAGAGHMLQQPVCPSTLGPDVGVPFVCATLPTDPHWTVFVSALDWSTMAPALAESTVACATSTAMRDAPAILASLFLSYLCGKRTMRGQGAVQGASVDAVTRWLPPADAMACPTQQECVEVDVRGTLPMATLGKLDMQHFLDFAHTTWNDVKQTWKHLGVEAARTVWIREMQALCGTSVAGSHLELMADMVFYLGHPLSILLKTHVSSTDFLKAAAFKFTTAKLAEAAVSGSTDYLLDNASLFVGRAAASGSNIVETRAEPGVLRQVATVHKTTCARQWGLDADTAASVGITLDAESDGGVGDGSGEVRGEVLVAPAAPVADADSEDDEVLVAPAAALVVPPPPPPAASDDDSDEDMLVAPGLETHPTAAAAAPASPSSIEVNPLLPPGTQANDFRHVGNKMATTAGRFRGLQTAPTQLLPRGSTAGDFVFTGEDVVLDDEPGGIAPGNDVTNHTVELVRRLMGQAPSWSAHDGTNAAPPANVREQPRPVPVVGGGHGGGDDGKLPPAPVGESNGGDAGSMGTTDSDGADKQAKLKQQKMFEDLWRFSDHFNTNSMVVSAAQRLATNPHTQVQPMAHIPRISLKNITPLGQRRRSGTGANSPQQAIVDMSDRDFEAFAANMPPKPRQAMEAIRKRHKQESNAIKARERRLQKRCQLEWVPKSPALANQGSPASTAAAVLPAPLITKRRSLAGSGIESPSPGLNPSNPNSTPTVSPATPPHKPQFLSKKHKRRAAKARTPRTRRVARSVIAL